MVNEQDVNPISAGVVILRRLEDEWHCLLLRAYQYWDFPKGLVEEGEDELAAAKREVEEETTLVALDFCWGHGFYQTPPYGKFRKIARYYIAHSPSRWLTRSTRYRCRRCRSAPRSAPGSRGSSCPRGR